jgi:ribose 5-phosphate isomerase A
VPDLVIDEAVAKESAMNPNTGVVTVGLFARRPADELLIGSAAGIRRMTRPAR